MSEGSNGSVGSVAPGDGEALDSYDDIPYAGMPYETANPARLAALARMHGMDAVPIAEARVLEIGCSDGGHLLPLAYRHRGATFVGIDPSPVQIRNAQRAATELRLDHIRFEVADVREIDEGWGEFDYIVCHGVYSWVPEDVRDAILRVMKNNLAPQGVAHISYNTWPGWQLNASVRDWMLYTTRGMGDPRERVAKARLSLEWLSRTITGEPGLHHALLKDMSDKLTHFSDSYVAHEYLASFNTPRMFHEVVQSARQSGLQFLGSSRMVDMYSRMRAGEVGDDLLEFAGDAVALEQHIDFLTCATFRCDLWTHDHIELDREMAAFDARGWYLSTELGMGEHPDHPGEVAFIGESDQDFWVADALARRLAQHVAERRPETVPFEDAFAYAIDGHPQADDASWRHDTALALSRWCTTAQSSGVIELHLEPRALTAAATEQPKAWSFTRWQAAQHHYATTLKHDVFTVVGWDAVVLQLLDGAHSRSDILGAVHDETRRIEALAGTSLPDMAFNADDLDRTLRGFAEAGMLVA